MFSKFALLPVAVLAFAAASVQALPASATAYLPGDLAVREFGLSSDANGFTFAAANNNNNKNNNAKAAAKGQKKKGKKGGKKGKKGGKKGKKGGAAKGTASSSNTSAASKSTPPAAVGGTGGGAKQLQGTGGSKGNNAADLQTSRTLDPSVLAKGFENNGQAVQEAGQVPSLTSSNNFINFCKGLTITNGQQITSGSCNPAPIGQIPSKDKMPSSKFTFPQNFGTIPANQPFTIKMNVENLETGHFTNAQQTYYSAPQQLNAGGLIIGHTHVVIEAIDSLASTKVTNPSVFAFFKGVNTAAVGGAVSADVTAGLPAGTYRLASINAAMNHQPAIAPVAQHGSLDDMVYFTVVDGKAAANPAAKAAAAPAAKAPAAPAAKAPAPAKGNNKKKN